MNITKAENETHSWDAGCRSPLDNFGRQLQSFKAIDDNTQDDSSRAIHTALNLTEIDSSLKSDSWKLKQVHERRHNLDTKTGDTFMGNLQRLFTFKAHVHEYTSSLKCPRWNAHSLSSDNTYGTLWRWLWLSGVLACPATEWPPAVMTTEWPEGEEETMKL